MTSLKKALPKVHDSISIRIENPTKKRTNQIALRCENITAKPPAMVKTTSRDAMNLPITLSSRNGLIKMMITRENRKAELLRNSG
jgi:hypothetical protein